MRVLLLLVVLLVGCSQPPQQPSEIDVIRLQHDRAIEKLVRECRERIDENKKKYESFAIEHNYGAYMLDEKTGQVGFKWFAEIEEEKKQARYRFEKWVEEQGKKEE